MIYDIFVNCDWIVTRLQQYSTHLHTNSTQNNTNYNRTTGITINLEVNFIPVKQTKYGSSGAKIRAINIVDSRKSEVKCIPLDQKKEELEQRVGE